MSLLEDIFLGDEASEAQELERIVDGDEFDEGRRQDDDDDDDNSVRGDDEAEEDKRRVDPTKEAKTQRVKNPRFVLNPARLTGPRGIQVIPEHFKDFKFKGKGQEKEELDLVLKKLEHWAYRLYPKFKFGDCLKKMETLGKKRVVMVTLNKIRNGQYLTEETVVQKDSSDDEQTPVVQEEDEFDKLLQQQIEIARQTPGPNSATKAGPVGATPAREFGTPFTMPKATASPSISDEQKERIMRNRRLAEERRLARMKQNSAATNVSNGQFATISEEATSNDTVVDLTGNMATTITDNVIMDLTETPVETTIVRKKNNQSNIIDSSDEECEVQTTTESIAVDVHEFINTGLTNRNNQVSEVNEKIDLTDNVETIKDKEVVDIIDNPTVNGGRKHNRSNVIDSSDEDCDDVQTMNASVTVDVHNSVNGDNDNMETVIDNCENEIAESEEIIVSDNDNNENGLEKKYENQTNGPNTEMTEDNTKIEEIQKKQDTETNQKCDDDDNIKVTRVDNKENIDNNVDPVGIQNTTVEDDVMDVDFTDDF